RRTENPILQSLLTSGQARPDPLNLGLDVTKDCAVIDAAGRTSERIFALGPVTAGVFWQIIAVPDIRVQAARLAGHLRSSAPRS
ncbi:MAG: FAD/NAD(P)-binding protein, partial [Methyloceanibacter sp.]